MLDRTALRTGKTLQSAVTSGEHGRPVQDLRAPFFYVWSPGSSLRGVRGIRELSCNNPEESGRPRFISQKKTLTKAAELTILGLPSWEDVDDKMRVDTCTGPSVEKRIPLDCTIMGFSERVLPLTQGWLNNRNIYSTPPGVASRPLNHRQAASKSASAPELPKEVKNVTETTNKYTECQGVVGFSLLLHLRGKLFDVQRGPSGSGHHVFLGTAKWSRGPGMALLSDLAASVSDLRGL
ncbi:unnamed protein product [Pleuronectes platessa]|uniref:Uncharacterized protein n=1 Tax=Pleuronectes platessa TaxID=8262 RepID=A0A9N7UJD1_PLEPL|nr:unnamed protein product [Pleuronectes platessa]